MSWWRIFNRKAKLDSLEYADGLLRRHGHEIAELTRQAAADLIHRRFGEVR